MTDSPKDPHYVTVEEARAMDCCSDPNHMNCTGPRCMAWRWEEILESTGIGFADYKTTYSKTHGYCGLVRG